MERNNSSSLRRGIALLDAVAEATAAGGATLTELAAAIGVHKSSALRLLAPLAEAGLVRVEGGRHLLGPRTAQLGRDYLDSVDLRALAQPALRRLVDESGESVHLVLPDLPDMVYIDKIDGPGRVRMNSYVGSRQPAHSTGVGRAYLAFAPAETVEAVVANGLTPRTERTVTDPAAFRAGLATIRGQGYAVDDIENEPDIRCVAGPVFDHDGAVVAAVSVAGLATRITPDRFERLGELVVAAGRTISAQLGAPPPQRGTT
ncbi:IclR family transcriptional regulator [Jiangella alkaliphila]|uniref:DNA-binding transcriptional regulator, IclR family n=1 Tax=Jiangella alkaliphila TaxID=419479 RepID=A0A1H2L4P8_9ACTN|nr:IclR family transcriptional regulator [Jiangella alkaliphila]SDU75762.1 DNA-binding transcriptional regulator, IclR family [Jiangella alkaliphila]